MKTAHDEGLTQREQQILRMVALGYNNKKISEQLYVSEDTVKKHLHNSYKKLGARNKIEALRNAGMIWKDTTYGELTLPGR